MTVLSQSNETLLDGGWPAGKREKIVHVGTGQGKLPTKLGTGVIVAEHAQANHPSAQGLDVGSNRSGSARAGFTPEHPHDRNWGLRTYALDIAPDVTVE